jgi:hypothetical protein
MATSPKSRPTNEMKRELGTALIRHSYDWATTCTLPDGMTRAEAIDQIKDWVAGYVPGEWDPRFGPPDKSYGGRRSPG